MQTRKFPDKAYQLDEYFADNLQAERLRQGIPRWKLALKSGVAARVIEQIETGAGCKTKYRRRASIGEVVVLAEALGVQPAQLLKRPGT